MSSKTEIVNLSLNHLGMDKEIANVDTEDSKAARLGKRFFDTARDAVLRDFDWPFATALTDLALVETNPNDDWGYSYRHPSDAVKLRRIPSGARVDSLASRIPFRVGRDSQGLLIFTNQSQAKMEYTARVESVELYSADFILALSYRLAIYMAPGLTAGDPYKLRDQAAKMYLFEISKAQSSAVGEEQPDQAAESEFITER